MKKRGGQEEKDVDQEGQVICSMKYSHIIAWEEAWIRRRAGKPTPMLLQRFLLSLSIHPKINACRIKQLLCSSSHDMIAGLQNDIQPELSWLIKMLATFSHGH